MLLGRNNKTRKENQNMKKNWAWIFLGVCIAAGVVCGVIFGMSGNSKDNKLEENTPAVSAEGSAEPEKQSTSTTASDEIPDGESKNLTEQKDESAELVADKRIVSPSSDDDIAEAMNDAAHFAWNWFWDNQYYDASKSIQKNGITFCPITKSGIHSEADVRKLTQQYFTKDVTEEMMGLREWMEKDNTLYTSETEGLGGVYSEYKIQIEKQSNSLYNIEADIYLLGEYDDHSTIQYKLENGNWIFDTLLAWPDENELIEIISADDEEKNKEDEDAQLVSGSTDSNLKELLTSECWGLEDDISILRFTEDGTIYAWGDEFTSYSTRRYYAASGEDGTVVGSYTLSGNILTWSSGSQYEYNESDGQFYNQDTGEILFIAEK